MAVDVHINASGSDVTVWIIAAGAAVRSIAVELCWISKQRALNAQRRVQLRADEHPREPRQVARGLRRPLLHERDRLGVGELARAERGREEAEEARGVGVGLDVRRELHVHERGTGSSGRGTRDGQPL